MKKTLVAIALAFGAANGFAQDLTSKKGEPILPEAGDWAIGVDANPFLDYFGNFFGKTTSNSAPSFLFPNGQQVITGKYFVDPQTAYRVGLRIGLNNNTQREMVDDRTAITTTNYPSPDPMVENTWKHSTTSIGLSAGIEKRKGKTRLQGYYGGELGIYLSTSKDKFTYGNTLNPQSTTAPVFVDADDAFTGANNYDATPPIQNVLSSGGRVLERNNGTTFSFGVRGFVGVEYFILPKISLGGEFGWGLGLTSVGKTTTEWESVGTDAQSASVAQPTTIEGSKQNSFSLDTGNRAGIWGPSGSLRLMFHF